MPSPGTGSRTAAKNHAQQPLPPIRWTLPTPVRGARAFASAIDIPVLPCFWPTRGGGSGHQTRADEAVEADEPQRFDLSSHYLRHKRGWIRVKRFVHSAMH